MDKDEQGLKLAQGGLDSESATGTQGRTDPETGAFGTGGTPMTTGDGVSASTIGTGSNQGEEEYKEGDFGGETPGSDNYSSGVDGESSEKVKPS